MTFTLLALQGFGGVLAIVQRELVERKQWMTNEEFVEEWSVAQIMPGPNVVNIALMIGGRYFGVRGALAALAGLLCFPLVLVLLLSFGYTQIAAYPGVAGALRGMGAVASGLIGGAGLRMIVALRRNVMGPVVCGVLTILGFVATALLRLPLGYVLLVVGGFACVYSYRGLNS
ncbi:chromate transporter [Herbaspirillum sp. RTI4]|nr:chromate transporter [Herbaspirillum sp. RTI4]MDY7579979.1 chromate transporter [Herbaspirillum sp. RTI4]MEA9982795.1 chromate transporter [Herbaspirillum sp. RTI4]